MSSSYDSILIQSFGGPEGRDEVIPFLQQVTRGRNVPLERLEEVAEQYYQFDGVSPLNEFCRQLAIRLEKSLSEVDAALPIYIGHRNTAPFIEDTAKQMVTDGCENALVFTTSAFSSFSGCRQYRQDIARATEATDGAIELRKLRLYYNHPLFIEGWVENFAETLGNVDGTHRVIFTAHSVPTSMAEVSEYQPQLAEAARLITSEFGIEEYDIVFQSRSGPPTMPWLTPDICDHIRDLHERQELVAGDTALICPLGFTSDHMEVMFDLDTQAKQVCEELGFNYKRVTTVGHNDKFVDLIVELLSEQTEESEKRFVGELGPWPDDCGSPTHCIPESMLKIKTGS